MNAMSREEFTFKFDGPAVERHEIEVSMLADSLVAFRSLAERACKMIHGKDYDLLVKVKAGFRPGSFSVDLILDMARDAAVTALSYISIGGSVRDLFDLYKWARGKTVSEDKRIDENRIQVKNRDGEVNIYNQCTFNMYQAASVRRDVDDLTRPLDQVGVESISLMPGGEDEDASSCPLLKLEKRDREFFSKKEPGVLREDEFTVTLEIVMANLRGEAVGWRFFDGSTDFSATIEDEFFLDKVKSGKVVFHTGDMLEVTMHIVQRRPSHRLATDRSIIEVLTYMPAQKEDQREEV